MKYFKILIFFQLILLLYSCSTIKEGFTNKKKSGSDEFLVEKKSPLVMPPDYNDLPVPNTQNNNVGENSNNIESLITNNEKGDKKNNNSEGSGQNLEKTLLNKIKKN